MQSAHGPSSENPLGSRAPANATRPGSRERDLILAALNQVDRVSTWTSQQGSSGGLSGVGLGGSSGDLSGRAGSEFVSPDAPTAAEASHPSAPRNTALPGDDTFPGYEIKREIHRGGQGVVYLANQLTTKRRVAIKVMHGGATLGTTGKARFDREVQLLGQLNHPNVVKLHDSGVTNDGSLFCVMDYISGKALDEVLREQRRERRTHESGGRSRSKSRVAEINEVEATLKFFAKVCDGVNAAHLKGVVHRDIKPANVRVDQSGEPILVDFGLAKVTAGVESDMDPSNPMTMTGQFIGSLPWASPEQATGSGDAIDLRTDVYSLGVMLYQMLTGGKFPYPVIGNMRDVLDNIQRVEPARPSTVRKQINDEVETIVLKALAKDRERRYQSAGELARDIRHYLAGEPIQAKRDSGWYVIKKTMTRHKAVAGFALAGSIIITGSAVGMTAMWRQAEGARAVAVVEKDKAEDNLDAARDLARTMLYDFGDSIKNLRGATEARGIVLKKALEYLALLGAQPDPSDDLLMELADAHERVGDLSGELYGANTGTSVDALSHYEAARDLRAGLMERGVASDRLPARLADAWRKIGEAQFKSAAYDTALSSMETASEIAARAGERRVQLEALRVIGTINLRKIEDAGGWSEEVAAAAAKADDAFGLAEELWAASGFPDAQRERAKNGLWISRLRQFQASLRIGDESAREDVMASLDESRELAESSIRTLKALSEESPQDYGLGREYWVAVHHLAQANADLTQVFKSAGQEAISSERAEMALKGFRSCVEIARRMTADGANLEAVRDLVVSLNKLGNSLLAAGSVGEARAVYAESMDACRALYAADPVQRHLRDLGVGQYKLAQADERRAELASTETERRALLELSIAEYQEARRYFQEFVDRGGPGQQLVEVISGEIDRVSKLLAGG